MSGLIAHLSVVPTGSTKQTASDNFDSYANGTSLHGTSQWSRVDAATSDCSVVNPTGTAGRFVGSSGNASNLLYWTAGTWAGDQWSQVEVGNGGGGAGARNVIAGVRLTVAGATGYFVEYTESFGGLAALYKYTASVRTLVTSAATAYAIGSVIRIEATGSGTSTRLTVKKNGAAIITNADPATYYSTGRPGIGSGGNAAGAGNGGDNWSASDI